MYAVFEHTDKGVEFKTMLLDERDVKELWEKCSYKNNPYEVFELVDVQTSQINPDEIYPNWYNNI